MIIKGRNIKIKESGQNGKIVINIALSAPSLAVITNKYGLNKNICIQFDDNYRPVKDIAPLLNTYKFDDGCGKTIGYKGAIAVNGHNTYNGEEWGLNPNFGKLLYQDFSNVIELGWDVENHSDKHLQLSSLVETNNDVITNNQLYFDRINYLMSVGVVPSNFNFYTKSFYDLNFISSVTQGAKDGFPIYPNNEDWNKPVWLRAVGDLNLVPKGFAQIHRDFTENWDAQDVTRFVGLINNINSNTTDLTNYFLGIGAHGWNEYNFKNFFDYVKTSDGFLVCSVRELLEYKFIKENENKFITQEQDGNNLKITYDLSLLPNQIRWQDLSFRVNADIQSITVKGADDFSIGNRKFNIYKEKTSWQSMQLDKING